MANAIYPKYKKACMSGGATHDLIAGTVKAAMIHTGGYTYNAAHEFWSDVPGADSIAVSGALTGKSVGDDASFQTAYGRCDSVVGVEVEAVILFIDTGTPSTSRLVGYFDTGITGLPVTPAGASYNIIPDASGWFIL